MQSPPKIEFTVQMWREGRNYIAHAMPLDVMSSGDNPEEAKRAVDEAVRIFIDTARDQGTLDEILLECGYEYSNNQWICPTWLSVEKHQLALSAS